MTRSLVVPPSPHLQRLFPRSNNNLNILIYNNNRFFTMRSKLDSSIITFYKRRRRSFQNVTSYFHLVNSVELLSLAYWRSSFLFHRSSSKKLSVFVLGASGYIGEAVAQAYRRQGAACFLIDVMRHFFVISFVYNVLYIIRS